MDNSKSSEDKVQNIVKSSKEEEIDQKVKNGDQQEDASASAAEPKEMTPEEIRQKCLKLFEESVQKEPVSTVLSTLSKFMENCQEVFSDCENDDDDDDHDNTKGVDPLDKKAAISSADFTSVNQRIGKLLGEMGRWAKELEKKAGVDNKWMTST